MHSKHLAQASTSRFQVSLSRNDPFEGRDLMRQVGLQHPRSQLQCGWAGL